MELDRDLQRIFERKNLCFFVYSEIVFVKITYFLKER